MNTRPTPSELPANIAAGDVVISLDAATSAPEANGWIKITPRGRITTRPGPSYDFDPEALAARFAADDVKLAIDLDHGIARLASQGHTVNAIGWVEELQARADGLYGRVDWLDTGKAVLAARSHRYVSPTFHHEGGRATWLHSVALVTAPALSNMPALADATGASSEPTMSKSIAVALGLQAEANETACLAAIATLKDGAVPKVTHEATLATLSAAQTEIATMKAAARKATVDTLLNEALKEKRIVPAQRDGFAALSATDEGFAQVTALLAATPKLLTGSGLDGKVPSTGDDKAIDPVALGAAARAFQVAQAAAGNPVSYIDAFAHAQAEATRAK